jgi:hypothetical protein
MKDGHNVFKIIKTLCLKWWLPRNTHGGAHRWTMTGIGTTMQQSKNTLGK